MSLNQTSLLDILASRTEDEARKVNRLQNEIDETEKPCLCARARETSGAQPVKQIHAREKNKILAATEKSQAPKATQVRRHQTETGNRFPGVLHYGAQQPSESITQEQKKNHRTEV
jgi:hypothetical protein